MRRGIASLGGFGTIEILVALSLFSIVLVSLVGLVMLVIGSGASSESASIATNVARAHLEQLRTLSPAMITAENDTTSVEQVPAGRGRPYTVHITVNDSDPQFVDITVSVSWQAGSGSVCAGPPGGTSCAGRLFTQSRTLETRVLRGGSML